MNVNLSINDILPVAQAQPTSASASRFSHRTPRETIVSLVSRDRQPEDPAPAPSYRRQERGHIWRTRHLDTHQSQDERLSSAETPQVEPSDNITPGTKPADEKPQSDFENILNRQLETDPPFGEVSLASASRVEAGPTADESTDGQADTEIETQQQGAEPAKNNSQAQTIAALDNVFAVLAVSPTCLHSQVVGGCPGNLLAGKACPGGEGQLIPDTSAVDASTSPAQVQQSTEQAVIAQNQQSLTQSALPQQGQPADQPIIPALQTTPAQSQNQEQTPANQNSSANTDGRAGIIAENASKAPNFPGSGVNQGVNQEVNQEVNQQDKAGDLQTVKNESADSENLSNADTAAKPIDLADTGVQQTKSPAPQAAIEPKTAADLAGHILHAKSLNSRTKGNSTTDKSADTLNTQTKQTKNDALPTNLTDKPDAQKSELLSAKNNTPAADPVAATSQIARGQVTPEPTAYVITSNRTAVADVAKPAAGNDTALDTASALREQITQSIATAAQQTNRQITIQLNPPELGRVSVKFSQTGSELTGLLEATNPRTCAEIRSAIPEILRSLEQSGVTVKRIDVALSDLSNRSNPDSQRENSSHQLWDRAGSQNYQDSPRQQFSSDYFTTPSQYSAYQPPVASSERLAVAGTATGSSGLDVLI